jgi:hypothetical protein
MRQLTIDGREVEYSATIKKPTPLTDLQREILRWLTANGSIRSVEAGVMVHNARGVYPISGNPRCGYGNRRYAGTDRAIACCGYAGTDGNEAMKRLMRRGLVRRASDRGPWVRVNPDG